MAHLEHDQHLPGSHPTILVFASLLRIHDFDWLCYVYEGLAFGIAHFWNGGNTTDGTAGSIKSAGFLSLFYFDIFGGATDAGRSAAFPVVLLFPRVSAAFSFHFLSHIFCKFLADIPAP